MRGTHRVCLLLALLACIGRAPCSAQDLSSRPTAMLKPAQTYYTTDRGTVLAPQASVAGVRVGQLTLDSPENCSDACRDNAECSWFNFCPSQEGCSTPDGQLSVGQCSLLASNGSLYPAVSSQGGPTFAGFPIRFRLPRFPGFSSVAAQGITAGDFPCPGSLSSGRCLLKAEAGPMVCNSLYACRTVVVEANGTERGIEGPVALLKNASMTPFNTFMSPFTHALQKTEEQPMTATFIPNSEGEYIAPPPAPSSAGPPSAPVPEGAPAVPPPAPYLGCVLADNAVLDGEVVGREGQPSPEACCRACRARPAGACNVWNFCGRAGGCQVDVDGVAVALSPGECELRHSDLTAAGMGYPPSTLARGPSVPFTAGSPVVVEGPQLEGYTLLVGRGLFLHGRFNCSESLRPELGECVLVGTPLQLADRCNQDPQCVALILKPGLLGSSPTSKMVGLLKHDASPDAMILTPTGLLYIRDSSSDPTLSAGAVAGMAVGAAAAAAAVAGLAFLAVRRRRAQRRPKPGSAATGAMASKQQQQVGRSSVELAAPPSAPPGAQPLPLAGAGSLPESGLLYSSESLGTATLVAELAAISAMGTTPGPGSSAAPTAGAAGAGAARTELSRALREEGVAGEVAALVRTLPAPLREWVVDPHDFAYCRLPSGQLQELGAGASARVICAVLRGEVVAAKEMDIGSSPTLHRAFLTEALHMQQLRHPHVVGFMGVAILPPGTIPGPESPPGSLLDGAAAAAARSQPLSAAAVAAVSSTATAGSRGVLLLEFCEGRDLHRALPLRQAGGGERLFGWYRRGRRVAYDVARGLSFLHSRAVVHMDVKSSNVLLASGGAAKLGDVGFARVQTATYLSDLDTIVGTFAWVAPEILSGGQQCTAAVDLFSFGVVLWEIVTGERPRRGWLRPPRVPEECPQQVADLIARCTSVDPQRRPTAQQLMQELGQLVVPAVVRGSF